MLDQDEAGQKATQEILSRLAKRIFARVIELPSQRDQPGKLKEEDLIRLLTEI